MKQRKANSLCPSSSFFNTTYISHSANETYAFAKRFATTLPNRTTLAFSGDLGAGKTTFIRGLVEEIAHLNPREVSSPTFSFLHIYEGNGKVYHFDLYRLPCEQEFLSCGFDDYLHADGICCIEWAERIPTVLPKGCFKIHIRHAGEECREIHIEREGI
jgi:tRNA threonylcarbamoyladenosine biosynthesis protein TsaE